MIIKLMFIAKTVSKNIIRRGDNNKPNLKTIWINNAEEIPYIIDFTN